MWIAFNKEILPDKQFYHDPNIQNKCGYTTAMYIALYCK